MMWGSTLCMCSVCCCFGGGGGGIVEESGVVQPGCLPAECVSRCVRGVLGGICVVCCVGGSNGWGFPCSQEEGVVGGDECKTERSESGAEEAQGAGEGGCVCLLSVSGGATCCTDLKTVLATPVFFVLTTDGVEHDDGDADPGVTCLWCGCGE